MTNPTTIIKNDHKEVETLFNKYKSLGDGAIVSKRETVDQIIELLSMHTEMEESIYYPKLKDTFNKEDEKMVEEAYVEHSGAKAILLKLKTLDPEDPAFDANVKVLMEAVTHHVKEEEEELLPTADEKLTKEELEEIAQEMLVFKTNYGSLSHKVVQTVKNIL